MMNSKRVIVFFYCGIFAVLAGCEKRASTESLSSESTKRLEACQLITNDEIAAVQGSPIKDTKSSERSDGRVRNSQCYFAAEESNRSVSLTVTQADPSGTDNKSAREMWEQTFGRYEGEEKENEADEEKKKSLREQKGERGEEEESAPPKKITGIGDGAFWVGNRVGGALYVLKKGAYIRISLGGPDAEDVRIEKSKTLAQKAIERL